MTTNSISNLSDEHQSKEALAQMLWTGGIIGFFAIQAIIWIVAITLTSNDPSHAVVADLDERVGSSDIRRAAREASDRLGWSTSVSVVPSANPATKRSVQIRISNQAGQAIPIEEIEVFGFHRARVTERKSLKLQAVEPGVWEVDEPLTRTGWWRFQGQAKLGHDQYQFELTEFLQL
ncbi:MAG: FixH family protein [Planctomycetaceae bacterium]|jgi:nitrogen fixation protein FixH|nr:FixH family protein [Planctomycetaceae bacterium]